MTFGILTPAELARIARDNPQMPQSRAKLAIPFIGKDCPSQASEFAHPDITIGLTVLAYRYEGLRVNDVKDVVASLQTKQLLHSLRFNQCPTAKENPARAAKTKCKASCK